MSGEERWRRVSVSGSLRGRRSEEMIPIKYFLPAWVGSISCVPESVMAIEVPQNEEISGGGKNGGTKGVGSAIRRKEANRGHRH